MNDLTPKQRRFVAEYLKDQNGTQAAIRSGYSERTANEQASQLLAKLKVKEAVAEKLREIESKSVLTAEEVRVSVYRLLQFDPRRAFNPDGTMKKIHQMPEDVVRALVGIDVDDARAEVKRIRFADRVRVLELAAKILGMLKFELTGKGGEPLVPPMPRIDFSSWTKEEILKAAGMRHGNGVSS